MQHHSGVQKVVLIYNTSDYGDCVISDLNDIKNPLSELPEEATTFYNGDPKEEEKLKDFFNEEQKRYLVLEDTLFQGCEAPNVLYLVQGTNCHYGIGSNVRCSCLRAVQNLTIINVMDNDAHDDFTIENVLPCTQFIRCKKVIQSGKCGYKCKQCPTKYVVCSNCRHGCDKHEHPLKQIEMGKDEKEVCMCKATTNLHK